MSRMLPKPEKRGPKPRKPIRRTKPRRPARMAGLFLWRQRQKLCDDLFSLYVRIRDGNKCRLCESTFRVQCMHLISRRYFGCRHLPENGWAGCARCHRRYTSDPLGWDALCEAAVGPVEWAKRKAEAQIPARPDYSLMMHALHRLLAEQIKEAGAFGLEPQIEAIYRRMEGANDGLIR